MKTICCSIAVYVCSPARHETQPEVPSRKRLWTVPTTPSAAPAQARLGGGHQASQFSVDLTEQRQRTSLMPNACSVQRQACEDERLVDVPRKAAAVQTAAATAAVDPHGKQPRTQQGRSQPTQNVSTSGRTKTPMAAGKSFQDERMKVLAAAATRGAKPGSKARAPVAPVAPAEEAEDEEGGYDNDR